MCAVVDTCALEHTVLGCHCLGITEGRGGGRKFYVALCQVAALKRDVEG